VNDWVTLGASLVIAALSGGVFGALMGRKTARDQIALDTRIHEDKMSEPQRVHRMTELQKSADALTYSIGVLKSAGNQAPSWARISKARSDVASGLGAVESYAPDAMGTYREADRLLNTGEINSNRDVVVSLLQQGLTEVHRAIADLG
jgi:hypothetical protein